MARRVNTKFVIILSSVLLLVALVSLLILGSDWLNRRDPSWLKNKAKQAEQAGKFTSALEFYGMAAQRSARTHEPDTADLFFHAGEISMNLSTQEPDPSKAQRYYEQALSHWRAALTENSKYLPAQLKFLDQMHQQAMLSRESSAAWSGLRETATKVIEADPKALNPQTANAYTYRAEAEFQLLQNISGSGSVNAGLKDIDADIQKAIELGPDKSEPVVLKSVVLEYEAQDADSRSLPKDAAKLRQADQTLIKTFLAKHPNDPQVSIRLAQFVGGTGKVTDMAKVLREAYAANPGNEQVGEALAAIDQRYVGDRVEAEKVLKGLVAAHPDSTDSYRRLAIFYQDGQRYDDAIQANKDVLAHLEPGGGVALVRRTFNELEALYNLCWINMDKAEHEGISTAEGKADLAESVAYADKFRAKSPPRAAVSLLDGRMHYLRDQIPAAIIDLHNADVAYSLGSSKVAPWNQTKILLAECFAKQSDWGTALTYDDQVLKAEPTRVPIMLHRAMVLNKVARYTEAEAVVKKIDIKKLPEGMQIYARTILATALDAQGKTAESQELFHTIDSPVAKLNIARSMAMDGDLESALVQLNELVAKHPDNETAWGMVVQINMLLNHKEAAQKALDTAIARFPQNKQFQVMQAAMKTKAGDSKDAQVEVLKTIPDNYSRYVTLAQFYRQWASHETDLASARADHESELASLQQAYSSTDNSDANHDNYALVVERIFNLSLEMAASTTKADEKTKYFDIAQKFVAVADRDNLDGVNGKLYQGRLEFIRDDQQKGIHTLEQAVAQRPDFSAGHTILGRAYMDAHQDDAALEQLRQAISQNPANLQAMKLAINILYKSRDNSRLPEAQSLLKQAYTIAPRDPDLAKFNDELGDPADAISVREKTYQSNPADLENTRRLAMLYVRRGDLIKSAPDKSKSYLQAIALLRPLYDKMRSDYEKDMAAKKLSDTDSEHRLADMLDAADILAHLYKQTDQNNDALTLYERFLSCNSETIRFEAMLLEGDMYHAMGSDNLAISTYESAIKKQKPGSDQAERRLADLYFEISKMPEAEAYYQRIYDREQVKDMRVLRRLAESLVRQEKYAPADELFTELFKSYPKDSEGIVLQGFSLFKQGKQQQAIDNFNRILNDPVAGAPNSHFRSDALYYRAFARFYMQQDLDLAVKDLELIRTESPDNLNAQLLLARVYRAAHHYAESANEYAQLLATKPDFFEARVEYAQFLYTLTQIQKQLPADSQEDIAYVIRNINPDDTLRNLLLDAEKRYPQQPEWLIMHGDLFALYAGVSNADDKAKYTTASQQAYAAAFNLADDKTGPAVPYLNSLLQSKNYDDVINIATSIIAQQPKVGEIYIQRSNAYFAKNKVDEATADANQAIALSGANPTIAVDIARQAAAFFPLTTVDGMLQKRLDAHKDELGTRIALAQSLVANEQPADAVKVVAPLRSDASLTPANKLLALRISALGEYESKDFTNAQNDYLEMLKENPNDIESLNNLAFMLADDLKRPKDGLPYAERAVKVINSTGISLNLSAAGNVLDTHGWVLYLSGDTIGSISDLTRAVALAPTSVSYLHLATAYQKAGRPDDAAKATAMGIRLAGKNDPSLAGLQSIQKTVTAH